VRALAGDIGPRNVWAPGSLDRAAAYIEARLAAGGRGVERQEYRVRGQAVANLELKAASEGGEVVVVGAHYDTVRASPGANDNGSGVAILLQMARRLGGRRGERGLRFVAFVNEEPPFFQTADMGSLRYARRCRERGERVAAMLSLETLGCYSDAPGSQSYPFPLGLLYPDRGDFVALVSNRSSAGLLDEVVAGFQRHSDFPCQRGAWPAFVPGVGWSDQWAFWECGYPAVMATDTAFYRDPHYHTEQDTPEKIDYVRLERVADGLTAVVSALAGMQLPGPSRQLEPSA
jgi:Zn-dependent M28 family amino/carboxypeptidase